ncbi:aa3-type cytochrome oxidase subunit CtaJ [Actinoplanes sp. CA-030573]|uniref:aa3-type cytochrome oxidase subunit CtaJ n=1 Tax=Actinoplanes sp. CA-030573 TaxID=3239898 RepID=UPI003D8C4166
MSISETVLIFVIIPAGVILLVASLVLAGSGRDRKTRRYRPGRPYDFQPIWFLASPEQVTGPAGGQSRRAIEAPVLEDISGHRVLPGSVGGASDSW